MGDALKMIRIGDSESPCHALSNGIALIRLDDKANSPCSHSQLETLGTLPLSPPSATATLPPTASPASRWLIIPTLDSETPGDRCMELCRATITARRRGVTSGPIIDQSQPYTACLFSELYG